jgi:hypothetical protein
VFLLAGDAELRGFLKCRFHRGAWRSKYSANFKKMRLVSLCPLKYGFEVVVGRLLLGVRGMSPTNG